MINNNILRWSRKRQLLSRIWPEQQSSELKESKEVVYNAVAFCMCIFLALAMFMGGCILSNPAHADVMLSQHFSQQSASIKFLPNGSKVNTET